MCGGFLRRDGYAALQGRFTGQAIRRLDLIRRVSVKGDVATITVPELSPFAIVVNANYNTSPVTSDITAKIAVSGAACFALIGVGFLALSKSKKEEN